MAVLLLVGIAFNSQNPLIASQTDQNTTDTSVSSNETGSQAEGVTVQEAASSESGTDTVSAESAAETPAASPLSLNFENDDVTVTVTAASEGIIPEGSTLKVVPIVSDSAETQDQYNETAAKVEEKAAQSESSVAGFLAYDITFVDAAGNEVEPNGEVSVVMDYKQAAAPDNADEASLQDSSVNVLHLEEDNSGNVQNVVDLSESSQLQEVSIAEGQKVEKTSFTATSFSTFVIYWTYRSDRNPKSITIHYVNSTDGSELTGSTMNADTGEVEGTTIDLSNYKFKFDGYAFEAAHINSYTGTTVSSIVYQDGKIRYVPVSGSTARWNADTYNIYMTYTAVTPAGGGSESSSLGAPAHNKYVKQNTLGSDYTLTLDVTGARGEKTGVDVLLVVDKSSSMKTGNRMSNLIKAADSAVDSLLIEGSVNRVAAVSFSSYYYQSVDIDTGWADYSDKTSLLNTINALQADGNGTNWALAMNKAETELSQDTSANKKVVIFLSDGEPNRYMISSTSEGYATESNSIGYAASAVVGSSHLKDATIYSVNLTDDENINNGMVTFANTLKNKSIDAIAVNGADIGTTMTNIIDAITTPAYTNVTITDTLSEYAELLTDRQYTVTKTDSEGNVTTLADTEYKITESADQKTITVSILNGGELEAGVKYSVSFHVKPTQTAIDYYTENLSYPDTGDDLTDALGNTTSSGQPGFYSNTAATVTYQENDGIEKSDTYKMPVIQINPGTIHIPEVPNPINGSITKTMGTVNNGLYPITLQVKTRLEETSTKADVDVILVIDTSYSMNDSAGNGSTETRLSDTKAAAKAFVANFVGSTVSTIHKVGIVTFGNSASILKYPDKSYYSGDPAAINTKIDGITSSYGTGTNTSQGLTDAKTLAGYSTNKKYVILLTDGVPTLHTTDYPKSDGGGQYSTTEDFNDAVDAAYSLKDSVDGIYTIGLLAGMSDDAKELDTARTLLASTNTTHQNPGYPNTYKLKSGYDSRDAIDERWDTSTTFNYSKGYFEITDSTQTGTELTDIWTELALIINKQTSGSTGDGWTVTDKMESFTDFEALEGATIGDYTLTLSADKKSLTTTIESQTVTVATYDPYTKVLTWNLNAALASKSIHYNHGCDYTYTLTYYVDFANSGTTEFRATNEYTKVTTTSDGKVLYPATMPFFVNVVGTKVKTGTDTGLAGAKFNVYKNEACTELLAENVTSDANGQFAFQAGQTDFTKTDETYSMTVYIKETAAPDGYNTDSATHTVTINVSNVTYNSQGYPSGTAAIAYTSQGTNDLLSLTGNSLVLHYNNDAKQIWGIVKRSANDHTKYLSKAEFELYLVTNGTAAATPSYKGTSGANGLISSWTNLTATPSTTVASSEIPYGTYILKETAAPSGYTVSSSEWTITISAAGVTAVSGSSTIAAIDKTSQTSITGTDANGTYFYFDDSKIYTLPDAGGIGTYLFTISGVAILMTALLLFILNKRKEDRKLSN